MSSTYKIDNVIVDTVTNALTASVVNTASYVKGKINVNEISGINNDDILLNNVLNGTASYALSVETVGVNQFSSNTTYNLTSSFSILSKNSETASSLTYPNTTTASYAITSAYAQTALTASYANAIISTNGLPILAAGVRFRGGYDYNAQYGKYVRPVASLWNNAYDDNNSLQRILWSKNIADVRRIGAQQHAFRVNFTTPFANDNYFIICTQCWVCVYNNQSNKGSGDTGSRGWGFRGDGKYNLILEGNAPAKTTNGFSFVVNATFVRTIDVFRGPSTTELILGNCEPWEMEFLIFKV